MAVKHFIYLSGDADNAGQQVGRAVLSNDTRKLSEISAKIHRGYSKIVKPWLQSIGGEAISAGGDEFTARIDADLMDQLEELRDRYQEATGFTISIGVGNTLSESGKALIAAKVQGKDQVLVYEPSIEDVLSGIKEESESEKQNKAYLSDGKDKEDTEDLEETDKEESDEKSNDSEDLDPNSEEQTSDETDSDPEENTQENKKGPEEDGDIEDQKLPESDDQSEETEEQVDPKDQEQDDSQESDQENDPQLEDRKIKSDDLRQKIQSKMEENDEEEPDEGLAEDKTEDQEDNQDKTQDEGSDKADSVPVEDDIETGDEQENSTEDIQTDTQNPEIDPEANTMPGDEALSPEIKQRIIESLTTWKDRKEFLDKLKETDPELHASIINMIRSMIDMAKKHGLTSFDSESEIEQAKQPEKAPSEESDPEPKDNKKDPEDPMGKLNKK